MSRRSSVMSTRSTVALLIPCFLVSHASVTAAMTAADAIDSVQDHDAFCADEANVNFLQVKSLLERELPIVWSEWATKMPEFSTSSEPTTHEMATLLNYLGDQLWMQILDGKLHAKGPHALDHTDDNYHSGMDGEFLQHGLDEYARRSNASEWETEWTADRLAQSNARFGGKSCGDARCLEMYLNKADGWNALRASSSGVSYVHTNLSYADETRENLGRILAEYYKRVGPLRSLERSVRLEQAFPILANLTASLAYLHPFSNANSRTRYFLAQTELVRLGGHPAILWDLKSEQYKLCGPSWSGSQPCSSEGVHALHELYLDGWCAWEFLVKTGTSPFQSGERRRNYDNTTGLCI